MSAGRGEVLAFIIAALREHERRTRANGGAPPAGVLELVDALILDLLGASQRQQTPEVERGPEVRDVEVMAVTYTTAAAVLEVSPRQVDRLVAAGRLKPVSLGGSKRIPVAQLHRLTTQEHA